MLVLDHCTDATRRQALDAAAALPPVPLIVLESDLPGAFAGRLSPVGRKLLLPSSAVAADLHELSGWALDRGFELHDLEVKRPTLEDVYVQLTAEAAADEHENGVTS